MTTQTLMPNKLSVLENAQLSTQQALAKGASSTAKTKKLPYQATHQVELLHLQAELDALFQQLQNLKQQRLISEQPMQNESEKSLRTPVLAGR